MSCENVIGRSDQDRFGPTPTLHGCRDLGDVFGCAGARVDTVRWLIARTGLLAGGLYLRDWMTNLPEGGASNRRTMLSSGLFVPP